MMLEHVPHWLGKALQGLRAGAEKLAIFQPEIGTGFGAIEIRSTAFADGGRLPPRFTADGEGISPPLMWSGVPEGTRSLALIVEDADAPSPQPLVHAIVWGMPADLAALAEGGIVADGAGAGDGDVGRNSYLQEGWLPPDPPTGHGPHRYAFQIFALGDTEEPGETPGRQALLSALKGKVLAAGLLTGTYSREEVVGTTEGSLSPA